MKINQILDKIDENQLFIPAFQREYRWKRDNAKDLVSSLIKGYPTGTMLTWETNNPPELKGSWQYNPQQGAVKLILDGQQRITTLYMLIRGKIPPYYSKQEIVKDPRGLYVNVRTLELLYYKKNQMGNDPCWVNITDIFQRKVRERDITRALEDRGNTITRVEEDLISDNFKAIEKIPDHDFPEQVIPVKAKLREAIDIFYIVNDSGIRLTDAELALAQISGYWPKAREEFKAKLTELEKSGFVFNLDFIVYALLGILHKGGSDLKKLHSEDNNEKIREVWKVLRDEVLDHVFNLMRDKAYVEHTKEINSVYALIPIIVYVYQKGSRNLSEIEIKKFIKWFYYSQIRQRYVTSLPQKLDKDIGIIAREESPFDVLINNIAQERRLDITPDEFIGAGTSHALFAMMRWYFKSRDAICLTTGVTISQNMGKKYNLENDHIFPYSLLKAKGYGRNSKFLYSLAQEATNRAVLTEIANRTKSNKQAKDYLADVKKKFPNALKLQLIPENEMLWEIENYQQFLEERRQLLANGINEYLENITETDSMAGGVSLEDMISEGENNELEFKSSLRWSYRDEKADKKLELVIMKSIAAFSNADGGTLLIGVDDNGEVLGLQNDYRELSGDKDKFELHLRNLLNNHLGKVSASQVKISFPEIGENELCQIDILKSDKPIFLQVHNEKTNQKEEKFYVRSGNSSQELSMSEANDYSRKNFKTQISY